MIYFLSNPAMENLYKVGLTSNSVSLKLKELSSVTGVPKTFQVEKIFEVDASKLEEIEYISHQKIESENLHDGKEFFEGS